jgi:hypothetical protein
MKVGECKAIAVPAKKMRSLCCMFVSFTTMDSSEAQLFNCQGSLSAALMPSGDRVQCHKPSLILP